MKERASWKNRATFIFAAIGSAVGLGNAWRFPGLAAQYGGGAFLLIYFAALVILGWPLLTMEIAIGRKMQKGAPGALYGINKKFEFVGWAAVINAFVIACYYAVILAWVIVMIFKAFTLGNLDSAGASNLFLNDVIQIQDIGTKGSLDIPAALLGAVLVAWIVMYLCIRKGAHSAGKVVKYTVIIPIVLLLVLAINGIVKDFQVSGGAGLATFFTPDFSKVIENGKLANLFIDAFGQVFYSLSVMMAIMIAYGSYVDKKSDVIKDSMWIAFGDLAISVLAGIVLFTTFSGTGMLENYLKNPVGGVGTAFIVYPQAMAVLTNSSVVNSIFAVIFYLTLFTLAIDSAFSIVEGVSTAISDKFHSNKRKTTLYTCIAAGLVSLLFASKSGLNWLDIVDHWANAFSLVLVGIIECIAVGWFFDTRKLTNELNRTVVPTKIGKLSFSIKVGKWYEYIIKLIAPVVLSVFLVWNIVSLIISYVQKTGGYENYVIWAQILGGWCVFALVFILAIAIQLISKKNPKIIELDKSLKTWDEVHAEEENSYIKATEDINSSQKTINK